MIKCIRPVNKLLKIVIGVLIVFVLSVSFSGFSINFTDSSDYIKYFYLNTFPIIAPYLEIRRTGNTAKVAWENIMEFAFPLNEQLAECSADVRKKVYIGEINSTVGEKSYSLYDYIVEENEPENVICDTGGEIIVVPGDGYDEAAHDGTIRASSDHVNITDSLIQKLYKKKSAGFLLKHFYTVDSTTSVRKSFFNVNNMLSRDFSIKKTELPQILIYHTHAASEKYSDNRSIVEAGEVLAGILRNTYGYNVIHDTTKYDSINGRIDRSMAYAKALPSVKSILSDNPSIEVVIDVHRDGIGSTDKATTVIDGKEVAKVMFFNGLSRNRSGDIKYLQNDNLSDNLSFSLQMKLCMMKKYPDLSKPIYLKGYRYNLHLKPRCMLIELGNQNNTYEEACNAMGPIADTLNEVLSGK